MPKIISPFALFVYGDVRIIKHDDHVFLQDYVPGGWEYFQMAPKQTLTYCIAELYSAGYAYIGRDDGDSVYYYRQAGTCA